MAAVKGVSLGGLFGGLQWLTPALRALTLSVQARRMRFLLILPNGLAYPPEVLAP
jgi:hypothetical protein